MPASITSEDSGPRPKVIGKSMAMVGIGPMPGSTPISVPRRQPSRAKPTFLSVSAALKPVARFWRRSNSILPAPPGRQRLRQSVDEHDDSENRQAAAEQERFDHVHAAPRIGSHDRQDHRRQRQTDCVDQKAEHQDSDDDEQDRSYPNRLDPRTLDRQRFQSNTDTESEDQRAEDHREVARSHF